MQMTVLTWLCSKNGLSNRAKTYLFIHSTALTIPYTNNQSSASGAAKSNIWDSKRLLRNNPFSTLPDWQGKTLMWNPAANFDHILLKIK